MWGTPNMDKFKKYNMYVTRYVNCYVSNELDYVPVYSLQVSSLSYGWFYTISRTISCKMSITYYDTWDHRCKTNDEDLLICKEVSGASIYESW